MDFLGIGPFEILLILILAFLFFGPEKLPDMAHKAGRLYRKLRKAGSDFSRSLTEDISSYNKDTDGDMQDDRHDFRKDLSDLRNSIVEDITSEKKPAQTADTARGSAGPDTGNTSALSQDQLSGNAPGEDLKSNFTKASDSTPDGDEDERG